MFCCTLRCVFVVVVSFVEFCCYLLFCFILLLCFVMFCCFVLFYFVILYCVLFVLLCFVLPLFLGFVVSCRCCCICFVYVCYLYIFCPSVRNQASSDIEHRLQN